MRNKTLRLTLSMLALTLTFGMFLADDVQAQTPPPGAYVQYGPPPDVPEEILPHPPGGDIWEWQRGHWRWKNGAYVWRPGHWVERPPHMAHWVNPHWQQGPNGWVFVEGHWQ